MNDAPKPFNSEQFVADLMTTREVRTDVQWIVARIKAGKVPTWLGGFGDREGKYPVWLASAGEALAYTREEAEAARLRCTDLPDSDDVLYAVCHRNTDNAPDGHDGEIKPLSAFEDRMLDSVRRLNTSEELRREVAKRIS